MAACGVAGLQIALLPTSLFVQTGAGDRAHVQFSSQVVPPLRLDQIDGLYRLVKQLERAELTASEAWLRLDAIYHRQPTFGALVRASPADFVDHQTAGLGAWAGWAGVVVFAIGIYLHFSAPLRSLPWMLLVLFVAFAGQAIGDVLFDGQISGFFGAAAMTPASAGSPGHLPELTAACHPESMKPASARRAYRGRAEAITEDPAWLRRGARMAGDASGRRIPVGWAVAVVVVVLAFVNVIDVRIAHASLVVGPVAAAGLLLLARWAGLSWHELGLGAGTWRRGLAWAAAAIGAVTVVFVVGAALPLTRAAFRDSRYDLSWPAALRTAFLLIPLGTVLFEEVAFRGVLWGLLRRARGVWTATVVSSALFGLWHVLPSLGLATDNEAIRSTVGAGATGKALSVLATVLFTGLSGVVFCELRRRSGSLLASAGLHWATNGVGVLAAAAVWAWSSR